MGFHPACPDFNLCPSCERNCIDETSSKLKLKQLQNWKPLYSANQVLEFKQIALSAARKYQQQGRFVNWLLYFEKLSSHHPEGFDYMNFISIVPNFLHVWLWEFKETFRICLLAGFEKKWFLCVVGFLI